MFAGFYVIEVDDLDAAAAFVARIPSARLGGAVEVRKHLALLEGASLVMTVRRGREKLHYLNPTPINEIAERWIGQYDQERVSALADLKRALEGRT